MVSWPNDDAPRVPSGTGRITLFPGPNAIECGRADWCQGCDRVLYRHHMVWTLRHTYRCLDCCPVGSEALPGPVADLIASMAPTS